MSTLGQKQLMIAYRNYRLPFRVNGTVTAGNASGVNDGAAALIIASEEAVKRHGLNPIACVLAGATSGVKPSLKGYGPVPSTIKLYALLGVSLDEFSIIELNEAFAAQGLAVLRGLGVDDKDGRVNVNGGAIGLGHPLGMSGAGIVGSAALELQNTNGSKALATMCVGVGKGISVGIETV